ncbi:MAG: prepilin-type N-terminal cleavage/methylation domain-containing protein [Chthoniobacteraceae bacterium]
MSSRHGFTLLELMLVVMIGSLIMVLAVPSVAGLMREQKLKQTFEQFDDFVRTAQTKAVKGRSTIVMVWEKEGINLFGLDPEPGGEAQAPESFHFPEGSIWTLQRPAALVKKPVWEWPFWRSGACEPVTVTFESPAGTWSAEYNGLTGRGKLVEMEVK